MSVILVKFDGPKDAGYGNNQDKTYAYFCDYNVQPGDRVIVESPFNGYVAVTVVTTAGNDAIKATKEVVCVVDDRRYKQRKAQKARLAEIAAEIERRDAQRVQTERFAELRKVDPHAAVLLAEAENIGKFLVDSVQPDYSFDQKVELAVADLTVAATTKPTE